MSTLAAPLGALAGPLVEAQQLLGAVDAVAPLASQVMPGVGSTIDAAVEVLPAAINFTEVAWEGAASLGAQESLAAAATTLTELGTSGIEIGTLTSVAAQIVIRGAIEVAGIAQRCATQAVVLMPGALTPAGQVAILGVVSEAISAALVVVQRVKEELAGPTARMWGIAAELGTAPRAMLPGMANASAPTVTASGEGPDGGTSVGMGAGATGNMDSSANSSDEGDSGSVDGASVTLPSGAEVEAPNEQAAQAVSSALSQQGVPYSWGGTTPGVGFDCSGLMQWAYGEAGVEIPRVAIDQTVGDQVSQDELLPGDLAVWDGHVAMYIGDGQIVEAGDPVSVSSVRTDNIGMQFLGFYRPTSE